jgi:tripartite-type tricarboxylate transporter receptor subunit TctC
MMSSRCFSHLGLALGAAALLVSGTAAYPQTDYPSRPIRVIVPVTPGGAIDSLVRALGDGFKQRLGQGFVVENRAGGGMVIAANACRNSVSDGYTLCVFTQNAVTLNPALMKNLPYDPLKDFEPVTLLGYQQQALVVHSALPVATFQELVEYSKKFPDKLNYGSLGVGSGSHLTLEWLKKMSGGHWTHVPFSGVGPILQAMASNNVHMFQLTVGNSDMVYNQIRAGKVKALLVPGDRRYSFLPDVPTYAEAGLPKLEALPWTGVFVPAGTPKTIIDKISWEMSAAVKLPEFQQKYLFPFGFSSVGSSADEFKVYVSKDLVNQKALVDIAGLKPE